MIAIAALFRELRSRGAAPIHTTPFAVALLGLVLAAGCGGDTSSSEEPAKAASMTGPGREREDGGPLTRTTTIGPLQATVTLGPAAPTLGDTLHLTLDVVAQKLVEVRMPAFGEALGRFEIVDFTPRRQSTPDGGTRTIQEYTLETPMSGPQVLPPLRVEFIDRRPNRPADADPEEIHELLTEKVSFEVASVLPEGAVMGELKPPRGVLPEWVDESPGSSTWLLATGIALVVALPFAAVAIRRWVRRRRRKTAYDVAIARLVALGRRGSPGPAEADAWYVELSRIVRRYLEDRFRIHAPEQTTEEFLNEAGRSEALRQEHRALLRVFLQRCDQVKFAAYHPAEGESMEALKSARSFLEETQEGAPILLGV